MINAIYCELLKLKKSKEIKVYIIIGLIFQIYSLICPIVIEDIEIVWKIILSNSDLSLITVFLTISIIGITYYVFNREYNDKTIKVINSYPCDVKTIFFSKVITICILVAALYSVKLIICITRGIINTGTLPEFEILFMYIAKSSLCMILQFCEIPLIALVYMLFGRKTNKIFMFIFILLGDYLSFSFRSAVWPFLMHMIPLIKEISFGIGTSNIEIVLIVIASVVLGSFFGIRRMEKEYKLDYY